MNLRKTIFFLFFISLIKTGFSEELISKELTNKKSQQVELEDLLTETNLDEETLKQELIEEAELNDDRKNNVNLSENENISENEEQKRDEENNNQKIIQKIPLSFVSEEMLARPEVEKFRRQYLNEKWLKHLYNVLESAMEYRLFVRKSVQDKNLPEILEYLPVVESNYKTSAKSKSGAIGMWQFMANSVYPFLVLDDFVDERLDPWKSTEAALKKLTENYNYFNDWLIAIAAYNCGVGAMNKILRKAEKKDFWYLVDKKLLPQQTADYVPKLIAIADLAINSEYYQINLPNHNEEYEMLINEKNGNFDYIIVEKAYSLKQLASEMRMDYETLKKLNPSFVRGMTYPVKKSEIRLPLGMKKSAEDAIAKLIPIDFPFKYTVEKGDSLWSISRKYKVSIQSICDLNDIRENDILRIGKILYIPAK
ncbi:MAG: transglycosylase SLT domain-containing protein [Spirochaetales bacterium]|nr:transglycosylase SLT domain-containing protein [Spirochaetales bacterium]MDY5915627.1 transglycosylase SLT domain-containing protein [Treponema sp.]